MEMIMFARYRTGRGPIRAARRPEIGSVIAVAVAVIGPTRLPLFLVESTHVAPGADSGSGRFLAPPKHRGWRAMPLPLLTAGAGIGALALLHFRDPHEEGAYGYCPFYALTGLYCPGCGGMRAVHNLTDGRVIDSLHSSLIAIPLILALAVWVGAWTRHAWRGQRLVVPKMERSTMWILLSVIAVYSVFRNTPWGSWLAPI